MVPQVAAIAGPLNGRVFPIAGPEFSVGRGSANDLLIQDRSVSRQHCVIVRADDGCVVRDLESRNGTYVNGLPVSERALHHGDELQIGNSILLFLEDAAATRPAGAAALDTIAARGTIDTLSYVDLLLPQRPDVAATTNRNLMGVAASYDALVRIALVLGAIRGFVRLGRPLLALLGDVLPARRGVLVLGGGPKDIDNAVTWERDADAAPTVVDRRLVEQVINGAAAVLTGHGPSATLSAPLRAFERVIGAIYLEGDAAALTPDHLELLTAVASIAGLSAHSAREMEWLDGESHALSPELGLSHQMVGRSPKMRQVGDFIVKVAPTDATALIRGESGTGKELVARAIHRNSRRAAKPFMALNCAALTESLIESELFGYEKGAFTGALARRQGKLEAANGGTVFLDEVGELPAALQAKLLRVLQEREFERVGGTQTVKVDVRLVAATNRDLERAVKDGSFRSDLYYRLNVVSITLAPLRDRREDILPLAKHFAARHAERCKRDVAGISEEAAQCLTNYDWPGNVRELENVIERAVVLGTTPAILPEDLGETVLDAQPDGESAGAGFHDTVRRTKRELIVKAFEQAGGSHVEAARLLGLQPTYLHRLTRVLNLRPALKAQVRGTRRPPD